MEVPVRIRYIICPQAGGKLSACSGRAFVTAFQNKTMTTQEIASKLVDLCGKGDFDTAQKELYTDDAISIEPYETPEFPKETKGLKAIIEKGDKFARMTEELHNISVSDPLVTGNTIAFVLNMDITMKGKKRMSMSELCVYQVKDGKIVYEQFFM
jgi:hypothetical protein